MSIYHTLDELNLDRNQLKDRDFYLIANSYDNEIWVNVCQKFLMTLDYNHGIDNSIVSKLWGIIRFYRENKSISNRQRLYLVHSLVEQWSNMGIDLRANIT